MRQSDRRNEEAKTKKQLKLQNSPKFGSCRRRRRRDCPHHSTPTKSTQQQTTTPASSMNCSIQNLLLPGLNCFHIRRNDSRNRHISGQASDTSLKQIKIYRKSSLIHPRKLKSRRSLLPKQLTIIKPTTTCPPNPLITSFKTEIRSKGQLINLATRSECIKVTLAPTSQSGTTDWFVDTAHSAESTPGSCFTIDVQSDMRFPFACILYSAASTHKDLIACPLTTSSSTSTLRSALK